MTPDIPGRFAAVIMAHPAWWIIFALVLSAIAATSLACLNPKKEWRWLRAMICASLAIEGVWLLCSSGFVG